MDTPAKVSREETRDIGEDNGTSIVRDFEVPFEPTGKIEQVTVDLDPQ